MWPLTCVTSRQASQSGRREARQRALFRCVVSVVGLDTALCGQIAGGSRKAGDPGHTYTHSHTETSSGASGGFLVWHLRTVCSYLTHLYHRQRLKGWSADLRGIDYVKPCLWPRGGVPMTKAERKKERSMFCVNPVCYCASTVQLWPVG